MAEFEPAITIVLGHEGGWSDHPDDPGGATNWGITLSLFREWVGDHATKKDLRNLTADGACDIYRACWWERYGYGRIRSQDVATKLLDVSVNMGPTRAHRLAQQATRSLGHPALIVDGLLGPASIAAINSCSAGPWLRAMCREQREFYSSLIAAKPRLSAFRLGWMRRAAWPYSAESAT